MDWTKQLLRYALVMFLQVFLFDRLQLCGVSHPYVYVLCLLMMPVTLSRSADMIIGAIAGLIMDVFCNSLGVHTASCILLMFIRPYFLSMVVNDIDRLNEQITSRSIGSVAFFKYVTLLVLIHHLTVFTIAAWSWRHMGFVLAQTIVSSIITIAIIIGYNALRDK